MKKLLLLLLISSLYSISAQAEPAKILQRDTTIVLTKGDAGGTTNTIMVHTRPNYKGKWDLLHVGDTVRVTKIVGLDARIEYKEKVRYVHAGGIGLNEYIDWDDLPEDRSEAILLFLQYAFLTFGLALVVIRWRGYNDKTYQAAKWLLGILIAIEFGFGYFYMHGHEAPTFDWADNFPYLLKLATALLLAAVFAFILIIQFVVFRSFIEDIKYKTKPFSIKFGLYSWLTCLVAMLIADLVSLDIQGILFGIYVLTQVIQFIIILVKTRPDYKHGVLAGLLTIITPLGITFYLLPALPGFLKFVLTAILIYFACRAAAASGNSSDAATADGGTQSSSEEENTTVLCGNCRFFTPARATEADGYCNSHSRRMHHTGTCGGGGLRIR